MDTLLFYWNYYMFFLFQKWNYVDFKKKMELRFFLLYSLLIWFPCTYGIFCITLISIKSKKMVAIDESSECIQLSTGTYAPLDQK
jgi:hypothetical protein